jgi:CTP:molybdopterin cytidylyltransferase MocA
MGRNLCSAGCQRARLAVGAVLLAAGASRRMGGTDKLLLEVDGVPLVQRTCLALSASGIDEVVVVRGHDAGHFEPLLSDFPVRVVRNEVPGGDRLASLRTGLRALSNDFDAIVVALADQPLLSADDVVVLIGEFKRRHRGAILVPEHGGIRGHPVIFEGTLRQHVIASGIPLGSHDFIAAHPALVATFDPGNDHYTFGLDTHDDVDRLERRLRRQVVRWPRRLVIGAP